MTREARYHRSARAIVDESHIPGRARLVLDPVDLELLRYTLSHRSRDRCDAPVDEIGALTITWVSVRRCVRPMQIWANRNPPRSMQPTSRTVQRSRAFNGQLRTLDAANRMHAEVGVSTRKSRAVAPFAKATHHHRTFHYSPTGSKPVRWRIG